MADKSWFNKLNPFGKQTELQSEVKQLRDNLDMALGEKHDKADYDAKFFDVEPSAFNGNGAEYSVGTDQSLDIAALQRVYASETWVYVAVTAVAKTIASLPWRLEKKQTIKKKIKNKVTNEMEDIEQAVWVDASGEKLNNRFQFPNPYLSRVEFLMTLVIDLLTAGEYYVYLDSDQNLDLLVDSYGEMDPSDPMNRLRAAMATDSPIKGMYRIPPSLIKPIPSTDKAYIEGYLMQSEHGVYAYHWAEIVHVKLPNPNNPFNGLSPLIASFKPVLIDRFSAEHIVRFYKSGARLGGVITTGKAMNKEQLSRLQRSFESNYTGRNNHHRTLILPPEMDYKIIDQNPAETALIEFCRYNREAILAAYGVPPIKVGVMEHANYANALVQLKQFFQDTIIPYLTFIEDGFNLKQSLIPSTGQYRIKFDLSDVEALRQNTKDQAESAKFMIDSGLTVNEVRELVWDRQPIPDGDKCKVVEDIKSGKTGSGNSLFLSAPHGDAKSQLPNVQADTTIVDPSNPTRTSFTSRVAALTAQFVAGGVPIVQAVQQAIDQARLEGFNDETDPTDPNSPDGAPKPQSENGDGKDGGDSEPPETGIGTSQNPEIIRHDVAGGKPKHPKGCDCADCKEDNKKDAKPSLADFIKEALAKLDPKEEVTTEFLNSLIEIYKSENAELVEEKETAISSTEAVAAPDVAPDQGDIQASPQVYAFGMSKESVVGEWKSFITKTEPMINHRLSGVKKFFEACQRITLARLGSNLKSFGLHKARNSDDVNDILSVAAYEQAVKDYIADIDKQLDEAVKYGYTDTLAKFEFKMRNEEALAFLKKYGAESVKYVLDTTLDQMRETISDAFDEGVAVTEVSSRIKEKYAEMENGRANTIARTETLTAVSYGREVKRQDWQKQFPDKKLRKMWVSSQDDKVRDSHQDVDGEVVDADEDFSNGLAYPREKGGEPEEVINCRCTDMTFDASQEEAVTSSLSGDESENNDESE